MFQTKRCQGELAGRWVVGHLVANCNWIQSLKNSWYWSRINFIYIAFMNAMHVCHALIYIFLWITCDRFTWRFIPSLWFHVPRNPHRDSLYPSMAPSLRWVQQRWWCRSWSWACLRAFGRLCAWSISSYYISLMYFSMLMGILVLYVLRTQSMISIEFQKISILEILLKLQSFIDLLLRQKMHIEQQRLQGWSVKFGKRVSGTHDW